MRIEDDWISAPGVQAVLRMLTDAGHRAYLVGGCVRNALLGAPVTDMDIATDALPGQVIALGAAAGLKVVPTGIEHGTVTVVAGHEPHEVTTFRRDVETFGRHAVVAFSDRVEDDAARRDFTMNALYADAEGRVIDPLGGLGDLRARRVRFVGDAGERIREDYLRILRFFRFHAWYGDGEAGLDDEGLAAASENSAGLETLSRERVGAEMRKILAAPDPAPVVATMQVAGILGRILPGGDGRALAPLVHLEGSYAPDPIRRLAVLGGADAEDRLRLSRAEAKQLATLADAVASLAGPAEIAYRHDAATARDVTLLRAALTGTHPAPEWEAQVAAGAAARFPVVAADLMPALSGAALGERLREIEARWIASGFELSREQLLA